MTLASRLALCSSPLQIAYSELRSVALLAFNGKRLSIPLMDSNEEVAALADNASSLNPQAGSEQLETFKGKTVLVTGTEPDDDDDHQSVS